jgi:hypothetical protein
MQHCIGFLPQNDSLDGKTARIFWLEMEWLFLFGMLPKLFIRFVGKRVFRAKRLKSLVKLVEKNDILLRENHIKY